MSVQDVLRLLSLIPKSGFYKYEQNGKKHSFLRILGSLLGDWV